jgi:hypothetical protein
MPVAVVLADRAARALVVERAWVADNVTAEAAAAAPGADRIARGRRAADGALAAARAAAAVLTFEGGLEAPAVQTLPYELVAVAGARAERVARARVGVRLAGHALPAAPVVVGGVTGGGGAAAGGPEKEEERDRPSRNAHLYTKRNKITLQYTRYSSYSSIITLS